MAIADESELMLRILVKEQFMEEVMGVLGAEGFREEMLFGGREMQSFLEEVEKWKVEWPKVRGFEKEKESL